MCAKSLFQRSTAAGDTLGPVPRSVRKYRKPSLIMSPVDKHLPECGEGSFFRIYIPSGKAQDSHHQTFSHYCTVGTKERYCTHRHFPTSLLSHTDCNQKLLLLSCHSKLFINHTDSTPTPHPSAGGVRCSGGRGRIDCRGVSYLCCCLLDT